MITSEAGSSVGGMDGAMIPMTTRTTILAPGTPRPTLSPLGTHPVVMALGALISQPPRTRCYVVPDLDPALFAQQIPQG